MLAVYTNFRGHYAPANMALSSSWYYSNLLDRIRQYGCNPDDSVMINAIRDLDHALETDRILDRKDPKTNPNSFETLLKELSSRDQEVLKSLIPSHA